MANDFLRDPKGYPFRFAGMKTAERADTLPPGKYPIAINVRAYSDTSLQTRPGLGLIGELGSASLPYSALDMRAYAALGGDVARLLTFDSASRVWLDSGAAVGTLAGGTSAVGASMIPFRPAESPTPWMYVANGFDYQKFSAPTVGNVVTSQKVGIAEPQTSPNAAMLNQAVALFGITGSYVYAGTAGAITEIFRVNDIAGVAFKDPTPGCDLYSIQVTSSSSYQRNMFISGGALGGLQSNIIQDVFSAFPSALTISAISYFTGTTGRCIVVPANLPTAAGGDETSIYGPNTISSLRRGAIIQIGAELCLVWSVTNGPNGTVCIETSTTAAHTTADVLSSVPAIQVINPTPPSTGGTLNISAYSYAVTVGIGTITASLSANPFVNAAVAFQPDDYISFGINVDDLANLTEMKILIDVGDGSFTQNFYYYTVRPSDIVAGIANTLTQLGAAQIVSQRALIDEETAIASGNQLTTASSAQTSPGSAQWSQITIPVSELTRVGNDQTRNLQTANAIQWLWNANATVNVITDRFLYVFGGNQPDVGDVGAPFLYRARPRSSVTGVVGNPSPATRYGVNARRANVIVALPSAAYDAQIDTWDVFRYGGTVTEWRFIGSTPSTNTNFTDNYDDAAAGVGESLDFDNFEPWPSVDVPNIGTATQVCGTSLVVTSVDPDIVDYLPGTEIQLGGLNVYTLRARPTLISGTSYFIQLIENAAAGTNIPYIIQEPFLANQHLPYMWGPDVNGTVFACGDGYRPGTVSFCKNYAPDSAPDTFNQEISQPAEPLLGGETIDGLAFVGSPERWWALYPQPQNAAQRYSAVQQPFDRGLAAPYGHCNDGKSLYWWAKDGIQSSSQGSLTGDLYKLFPHEGIAGENYVYGGITIYAPDYTRVNTFRLIYSLGYLYAIYQDTTGAYRMLTLDTRRGAWCVDQYSAQPTSAYHIEQEAQGSSAVTIFALPITIPPSTHTILLTKQQANSNDYSPSAGSAAISASLATNEFDGGDSRAPKQWGDFFVDCLPESSITVTPMSIGAGVAAGYPIPISPNRVRVPISVGGIVISDFMGMLVQWQDDFRTQSLPTKLYSWQPSFVIQPARTISWATFGTSYGIDGYFHIRQLSIAYVSTAPITITCATADGQDPNPVTLPSTGGILQKVVVPLSANKGLLFTFAATSAQKFQIFSEMSDIYVGAWGRQGPYVTPGNFGGDANASSPI